MFAIPLSIVLYIVTFIFGMKIFMYTHKDTKRVRKVRIIYLSGLVAVFVLLIVLSFVMYDSQDVDAKLAVFFLWAWVFPGLTSITWILQWVYVRD